MQTPESIVGVLGKTIHRNKDLDYYHKSNWKGLKMTKEEILYFKFKYHDMCRHHLDAFMRVLKTGKYPSLYRDPDKVTVDKPHLPYFELVDEENYLTPYILCYNKDNLKFFWLITYNVNMFNLSYHEGLKKSSREISPGHVAPDAEEAVKFLKKNIRFYTLDGKTTSPPVRRRQRTGNPSPDENGDTKNDPVGVPV